MEVKIYKDNTLDRVIKTAYIFKDSDRVITIFSDYDEDLTCSILKCFIDGKYEKVTSEE